MDAALRRWVEDATGAAVRHAERRFSGGSRELWFIDVGARAAVLRVETGAGAFHGTPLTLEREAAVCRAVGSAGVPVPEVLAVSPDGTAVLMECVAGTSDLRDLTGVEERAVVASFMRALGALHRVDVAQLDLPGITRPRGEVDHALDELDLWEQLWRPRSTSPDPLLSFAVAWLRANAPTTVSRTVLAHGDAGAGNFLHARHEVTALVDWEMSHVGDPMDDLAWVDVRAAGGSAWDDVAERDRVYEQASGLQVDEGAVAYYRVLVLLRCTVTTGLAIGRGGGALGVAAYLAPHHRFRVQLASALAEATGAAVTGIDPLAVAPSPAHDAAIEGLRSEVLPALRDRSARLAARAALLVLEHARAEAQVAPQLAASERRDVVATFGRALSAAAVEVRSEEAGPAGDGEVLGYLLRRSQRGLAPWATPTVGEDLSPVPSPRARR